MLSFIAQILLFPLRFFLFLYYKITYFFTKKKILFIKIPKRFDLFHKIGLIRIFKEQEENYFDYLNFLKKISEEPKIEKIILFIPSLENLSLNQIEDMMFVFQNIKQNGKVIFTYVEEGGIKSLLLASIGDFRYSGDWSQFVVLLPFFEEFYLKNFLNQLGIKIDVFTAGKFKSAGEMYSRNSISKYAKENLKEIIENRRSQIYELFIKQKHLSETMIQSLWKLFLDQSIISSKELFNIGFFNELVDFVQLKKFVITKTSPKIETFIYHKVQGKADTISNEKPKEEDGIIDANDLIKLVKKREFILFPFFNKPISIALVVMDGIIHVGEENDSPKSGSISAKPYSKIFQELKDSKEKAVLIYLNSPGGMSDASEILYQEIRKLSRIKPVYVFQGAVAASGGYYISCAANKIIANSFTITGSIGVLRIRPNLKKFYDKYKIKKEILFADKTVDIFSEASNLNKESRKLLNKTTIQTYHVFIDRVSKGRGISFNEVFKFAEGKVFSSVMFHKHQFIDHIMTFTEIFDHIKEDLNISKEKKLKIVYYPLLKIELHHLFRIQKHMNLLRDLNVHHIANFFNKNLLTSIESLLLYFRQYHI